MRIVNTILCLLMLLFIVVQYNDPDGPMWMVIYSVPAIWAALAAFAPAKISTIVPNVILGACIVAALAGMFFYWPTTPGWWRQEVWWDVETAREGMGMMIVTVVLLSALIGSRRYIRSQAEMQHEGAQTGGNQPG